MVKRSLWLGLVVLVGCGGDDAPPAQAASQGAGGSVGAGQGGGAQGGGAQGGAQAAGASAGGATSCGQTCYEACLCDGKAHDACVASCLGGPAAAKRIELKTTTFTLPPHQEMYRCQNFKNPFGEDVEVAATESFMSPGSHHLFAFYRETSADEPLEECSGLEFTRSIHTSQSPYNLFHYPDGVAARIKAKEGVRMALHYINTSDKPIEVSSTTVFYLADAATVTEHASHLFFNNVSIFIASHAPGKATKTCTIPKDIKLFSVTSHMHKFGKLFTASTDDGTSLYETTSWSDAPFRRFDPPLELKKGQKISFSCEYQNTSDKPLTFGESAETNEMCILSGRYFPAADGETIECM